MGGFSYVNASHFVLMCLPLGCSESFLPSCLFCNHFLLRSALSYFLHIDNPLKVHCLCTFPKEVTCSSAWNLIAVITILHLSGDPRLPASIKSWILCRSWVISCPIRIKNKVRKTVSSWRVCIFPVLFDLIKIYRFCMLNLSEACNLNSLKAAIELRAMTIISTSLLKNILSLK